MAANDNLTPGALFGRYQLVERLGEGGMASVWKAFHLDLKKPVAIKVLKPEAARIATTHSRFLREGEAIARVRHGNVIDVTDFGTLDGVDYLVMEFLEGRDLHSFFRSRSAVAVTELADLMVPVCAAVAAAHDAGVVHRDLKPENIFLAQTRDRGIVPKVLDFGISRVIDDESGRVHTVTDSLLGTPRYLSPEQADGRRDVGAATDQYSLGVILYLGATGRFPIDDTTLYSVLHRVIHGQFPAPRAILPTLPVAFEAVILRAMATRPEDRFASMNELGAALLPFASERVRWQQASSFGEPLSPSLASHFDALPASTTLEESAHEVSARARSEGAPPGFRRRSTWLVLGGLVLAGAAVAIGVVVGGATPAPTASPPQSAPAPRPTLVWMTPPPPAPTPVPPPLTPTASIVAPLPSAPITRIDPVRRSEPQRRARRRLTATPSSVPITPYAPLRAAPRAPRLGDFDDNDIQ